MAQISDSDYNSNAYFFLTNYSDVLKAGKNSFTINPTPYLVPDAPIFVSAYDINGNEIRSHDVKPQNAKYPEETNTGQLYCIHIPEDTINGVGRIEIRGTGLSIQDYTGSFAYYRGQAYKVSSTQRLPLTSKPSNGLIPTVEVIWTRNILIDTTKKTESEVRFFASPYIRVKPEIYAAPSYPTGSYRLASGNCSAVSVYPKHNADGDYDNQFDTAIYQIYLKSGTKFSALMEGENIRLKNPTVTKFRYSEYKDTYQGILNTDFIAKISRVVNESSLLLDIPFTTVADLIGRTNQDSPYAKNNLTEIKDFTVADNMDSQNVYHKKNIYALSITDCQYEIFYKNISPSLPMANTSGSMYLKSLVNIECNNIRTMCGHLDFYRVYGKSLNSPENRTLLTQGYIKPDQAIQSTNFNNAIYDNPAHFYNQNCLAEHWFVKGTCTILQNDSILINGAYVGHTDNSSLTDYVIFKDNTDAGSRNSLYASYALTNESYWYANSDAFINQAVYPTASYTGTINIPSISVYAASQENLLTGIAHDCNPIKFRQNTLYKFSMRVKAAPNNTSDAKLYVYAVSGNVTKRIGYVDSSYNYGADELYENTFFCQEERFGTIILVPVKGYWHISSISITPYQSNDYSVDSFAVKVPLAVYTPNEYYEIELELYDTRQRLAYGEGSYTFVYNKKFLPLKKRIFIDPAGLTTNYIAGTSPITPDTYYVDGGNASGTGPEYVDIILDGGNASSTF